RLIRSRTSAAFTSRDAKGLIWWLRARSMTWRGAHLGFLQACFHLGGQNLNGGRLEYRRMTAWKHPAPDFTREFAPLRNRQRRALAIYEPGDATWIGSWIVLTACLIDSPHHGTGRRRYRLTGSGPWHDHRLGQETRRGQVVRQC